MLEGCAQAKFSAVTFLGENHPAPNHVFIIHFLPTFCHFSFFCGPSLFRMYGRFGGEATHFLCISSGPPLPPNLHHSPLLSLLVFPEALSSLPQPLPHPSQCDGTKKGPRKSLFPWQLTSPPGITSLQESALPDSLPDQFPLQSLKHCTGVESTLKVKVIYSLLHFENLTC